MGIPELTMNDAGLDSSLTTIANSIGRALFIADSEGKILFANSLVNSYCPKIVDGTCSTLRAKIGDLNNTDLSPITPKDQLVVLDVENHSCQPLLTSCIEFKVSSVCHQGRDSFLFLENGDNIARLSRQSQSGRKRKARATDDMVPMGLITLDASMQIRSLNGKAEQILNQNDGLSEKNGILKLTERPNKSGLKSWLEEFAKSAKQGGEPGKYRTVSRPSMLPAYLVSVLNYHPPEREGKEELFTLAITDSQLDMEFDWTSIKDLFDLTDKEAMIVAELATGKSVADASEEMDISQGTLRQHLKRVFAKLGVSRQSELVKLVFSSPAYFKIKQ